MKWHAYKGLEYLTLCGRHPRRLYRTIFSGLVTCQHCKRMQYAARKG